MHSRARLSFRSVHEEASKASVLKAAQTWKDALGPRPPQNQRLHPDRWPESPLHLLLGPRAGPACCCWPPGAHEVAWP